MKKHLFSLIIAAAAIMGTTVSCTKDDNVLPEVIESHVLDSGVDEDIKTTTGSDGTTTLSYKSWIFVNQMTRSGDNRFDVTLNNQIGVNAATLEVNNFSLENPRNEISCRQDGSRREGYITVLDSVLVYKVIYSGFSFSYELKYQVPVFDDGVTRQVMPYYRYGNITGSDGELSDLETVPGDGCTYYRKMFRHQIGVNFHDKTYAVINNMILQKAVYPEEDVVLAAEVVARGIEPAAEENTFRSWATVRKQYSVSGVREYTVEAKLRHRLERPDEGDTIVYLEKRYWPGQVSVSHEILHPEPDFRSEGQIRICRQSNFIIIDGRAGTDSFRQTVSFFAESASYSDEDISFDLPSYGYRDISFDGFSLGEPKYWYRDDMSSVGSGVADMYTAKFNYRFSYTYKDEGHSGDGECVIALLEWVK